MMKGGLLVRALLVSALLGAGVLFAQNRPMRNVSRARHPNLAAARFCAWPL